MVFNLRKLHVIAGEKIGLFTMSQQAMKIEAARAALGYVEDGMRLGIGTGSTAEEFVKLLAERVNDGLKIIGVPTSERTAHLCVELGVPLSTLEDTPELDLTIDGADELDAALSLVKGGGGALLREKIVAYASTKMIVIADESKVVDTLGAFPLPIEVNQFGLLSTTMAIEKAAGEIGLQGAIALRQQRDGQLYKTDGDNLILDASFGHISDPHALSNALHAIPGVVEHGLFIGLCDLALVATPDGTKTLLAE